MKDNRPIAKQVAELTEEQRKTIRRVGLWYDAVMFAAVLIYIIVTMFFMLKLDAVNRQIEAAFTAAYTEEQTMQYLALIEQQEQTMAVFVPVAIVGLIGVLVTILVTALVIAKKYPFYSDKRFVYIGRQNRQAKKKTEE